jgi:uncharacterized membrane protein YphA (DoxX/SURF4 family)
MSIPLPIAHEMWFDANRFPLDWGFAGQRLTLAFLALALAVTIAVRLLARLRPGVDVPLLAGMAPYMPFAVRIHLAVSLIGLLSMGTYLSPAMHLPHSVDGWVLGITMAIAAILMATGFRARWAAALLIAAGPLGMLEFGVSPVLQRVDVLGLALFVLVAGAGRWSADYEQGRTGDPSLADSAGAVWSLRLAAGGALIVVAFMEKLANPKLALDFLAENPHFNVAQQVGIHITDLQFIRVAGAIEVLFGLLVMSGALPQLCVLIAGIPFNATLYFFGTEELLGHLPIYAAMLVLLVYGSHPQLRPLVSALRIPAHARGALPALKAALQP